MSTNSFVQIPTDAGNTGKKVHTKQRTVGIDIVQEHVTVLNYPQDILGLFYGAPGAVTILETAHATNTGFIFLVNPLASGITTAIRKLRFLAFPSTTSARTTVPEINIERFTFTGTPSGATILPSKRKTSDDNNISSIRTAPTGMTITPGAVIKKNIIPIVPSGVTNISMPIESTFEPLSEEGELELEPGEGIVWRQHTNGDSGDDRMIIIGITWLEF